MGVALWQIPIVLPEHTPKENTSVGALGQVNPSGSNQVATYEGEESPTSYKTSR